jgi:hypothetical protein
VDEETKNALAQGVAAYSMQVTLLAYLFALGVLPKRTADNVIKGAEAMIAGRSDIASDVVMAAGRLLKGVKHRDAPSRRPN